MKLKARPCEQCGRVFMPSRGYHKARFCSKPCVWKATKSAEFNARVARATIEQRAAAMRGTETRGYVKRNGRHEHRLIAEQKVGRALLPGEIVHHIDGDKHNNRPDNLAVMTQGQHMREHGLALPGVTMPWKPHLYRRKK